MKAKTLVVSFAVLLLAGSLALAEIKNLLKDRYISLLRKRFRWIKPKTTPICRGHRPGWGTGSREPILYASDRYEGRRQE